MSQRGSKDNKAQAPVDITNPAFASRCGKRLLKRAAGNRAVPIKEFAYNSVEHSLGIFFNRPHFIDQINKWRDRADSDNVLHDVYDGRMWKEWKQSGFLDDKHALLLTLNVDWFQPF
ncbi:hypothetical protein O0I10_012868 [Lichtheimia ornata]|uniref:Uncharacterized protein n=1 Tax=Lichtheimia ornata TaxID=688661 RepID=A0AAD7XSQ8_9FUNG|nr:uncharacterized protein O0I10_012868 [Lichtheimia ornata]KAJ8651561.1 hypothetical protein O0I10_012868 [Lichtheimia ornata]